MHGTIEPRDFMEALKTVEVGAPFSGVTAGNIYRCENAGVDSGFFGYVCSAPECDGRWLTPSGTNGARMCAYLFRPIYRPRDSVIRDLERPLEVEPA